MDWQRWPQRLANRGFWEADTGECAVPFDEGDIRREAAFRCWLRQLEMDVPPPTCLPDERELDRLALQWDGEYGADAWWSWPTWSTCPVCAERQCVSCPDCRQLAAFTNLSWHYTQTAEWRHPSEGNNDENEPVACGDDFSAGVCDWYPQQPTSEDDFGWWWYPQQPASEEDYGWWHPRQPASEEDYDWSAESTQTDPEPSLARC
jgi:hypothetical protein